MPVADPGFGWIEATLAFGAIAVAAFLVTWVVTDLLGVRRTPYVAILLALTLGLGAAYVEWSGTALGDLVAEDWGWGILAGLVAAAIAIPFVRRVPAGTRARGGRLAGLVLWEGVAYGIAEAVLLSTLPVIAVWQASADLEWTAGTWAKTGAGALAIAGSLVVILVHHLGYREFRARTARTMLLGALLVCGVQAIAFLLTGNVLAPVVAHIVLHVQILLRGLEMPPAAERPPAVVVVPESRPVARHRTRA